MIIRKKYRTIHQISISIILLVFAVPFSYAQDIHFSQYNMSPLNLNPATTGFFEGTYRFTLNNRTQWRAVTTPYTTTSVSADKQLLKRSFKQDMFGAGLVIYRDKAGDSDFGTTQINGSFSWIKALNKKSNQYISFAIQPGIAQRTINYEKLMFDSQYNGSSYDPNLSNNEQFSTKNFFFFDINAGAYWFYKYKKNLSFDGGLALFHLNTPHQSLFDNKNIRLDRKLVINANSVVNINPKFDLLPSILFMNQGKYRELDLGAALRYINDPRVVNYMAFSFGLWLRAKDATLLSAQIDYHKVSLGISYDINISNLTPASNERGGLEIALKYILDKKGPVIIRSVPCPIF